MTEELEAMVQPISEIDPYAPILTTCIIGAVVIGALIAIIGYCACVVGGRDDERDWGAP